MKKVLDLKNDVMYIQCF